MKISIMFIGILLLSFFFVLNSGCHLLHVQEISININDEDLMLQVEHEQSTIKIDSTKEHFYKGWGDPDAYGIWAMSGEAKIKYTVIFPRDLLIYAKGFAYKCDNILRSGIEVLSNGHFIKKIQFYPEETSLVMIKINKEYVHEGENILTLRSQGSCTDDNLSGRSNSMTLSFHLNEIRIDSERTRDDYLKNTRFTIPLPLGQNHTLYMNLGAYCPSDYAKDEITKFSIELLKQGTFSLLKQVSVQCSGPNEVFAREKIFLPSEQPIIPVIRLSIESTNYSHSHPLIKKITVRYQKVTTNNKKPNVMLWLFDAMRYDHVGAYGYSKETTPALDALAAQGIIFKKAYSQAPFTIGSVPSLLSSRYPFWNVSTPVSDDLNMLPEVLSQNGYHTVLISQSPWISQSFNIQQGFNEPKLISGEDNFLNETIFPLIKAINSRKNFFVYIHIIQPHMPYIPPAPFYAKFAQDIENVADVSSMKMLEKASTPISNKIIDDLISQYDANISYGDYKLSKIIKLLKYLNIFHENLFTIISADHGEEFFDHKGFEHSGTLWEEVIHVPLIFYYEKFSKKTIDCPVELIDIAPTILEIAGIDTSSGTHYGFEGKSLLPFIKNEQDCANNFAFSVAPAQQAFAVISSRYKLIDCRNHWMGYKERTYECHLCFIDMKQKNEICKEPSGPEEKNHFKELRKAMNMWIVNETIKCKPLLTQKLVLPPEQIEKLKALGYVGLEGVAPGH